jgi:hypothetical protein
MVDERSCRLRTEVHTAEVTILIATIPSIPSAIMMRISLHHRLSYLQSAAVVVTVSKKAGCMYDLHNSIIPVTLDETFVNPDHTHDQALSG